jgi:hypothetical protein
MKPFGIVMLFATVGNVAFAGLHLWEHDIKMATISLLAAGFCVVGLTSQISSGGR